MAALPNIDLAVLTIDQQYELVDKILGNIQIAAGGPPEWHREALDEILDEHERNPQPGTPYKEVLARLEKKWQR